MIPSGATPDTPFERAHKWLKVCARWLWRQAVAFFRAAPGAIRGYINLVELIRALTCAIAAGGGTWTVIRRAAENPNILLDPDKGAILAACTTFLFELARRIRHGH